MSVCVCDRYREERRMRDREIVCEYQIEREERNNCVCVCMCACVSIREREIVTETVSE